MLHRLYLLIILYFFRFRADFFRFRAGFVDSYHRAGYTDHEYRQISKLCICENLACDEGSLPVPGLI